jgi:hypothetical protein
MGFNSAFKGLISANARVKLAKTGHGPHFFTLVVVCVVRLLFVLFYRVRQKELPDLGGA